MVYEFDTIKTFTQIFVRLLLMSYEKNKTKCIVKRKKTKSVGVKAHGSINSIHVLNALNLKTIVKNCCLLNNSKRRLPY